MKQNPTERKIFEYNSLLREMDDIYGEAVKGTGLSESAFWILYTLRADSADGVELTQSHICRVMYQPKQTVNTALKKLEAQGLLSLSPGSDRRAKYVRLTGQGVALAEQTVDRIIAGEEQAFAQMTAKEREELFRLMREFSGNLRSNLLTKEKEKREKS